jgi:sodium/proline symporter
LIYLSNHPETFASGLGEALEKAGPSYMSLVNGASGFEAGLIIVSGFSWFFGYLGGQPQLAVRFMAISDMRQARKARNVGIVWTLVAYIGALMIGWIGLAIFGPAGLVDQEYVMPAGMLKIFPPVIASILITGAIAAMISTADSLLILSATEFSENILKPMLNKFRVIHSNALLQSRLVTASLAIIALGLAYVVEAELIFSLVSYVWAGIGGTFSVVILLTLLWPRYHGRAVVLTIISGLVFTIIWISTGMEQYISARLLTFFVALLVAITTSYLVPKKQHKVQA